MTDPSAPRKLALTSPADIHFIHAALLAESRALQASFSQSQSNPLPPSTSALVEKFIRTLLTNALPSIEVNGRSLAALPGENADEEEEEEEYDARLHEEVTRQQQEIERLTVRVTGLRREAPGRIAESVRRAVGECVAGDVRGGEGDGRVEVDEDEVRREVERLVQGGVGVDGVQGTWEDDVIRVLEELRRGMPEAVGRLKRAGDALD